MPEFMRWSDDLVTGIDIVDQQHRGLVDHVNQAAAALVTQEQASRQQVDTTLKLLMDYAVLHFQTEEALMARHGIEARVLAHHRRTHAAFADKVTAMAAALQSGQAPNGVELLSFLAGWLVYHILGEDQTMARQIKAINAGLSAEDAFTQAQGNRLAPSQRAMTNTLVGTYRNLSQRIHELAELNNLLDARVAERTAQLEFARQAAEAGNLAKARFINNISHELRTPLNAIQGFAEGLSASDRLAAEQSRCVSEILTASRHLLRLINGLIDYSRGEDSDQPEPQQTFAIAAWLEALAAPFAEQAQAKGLDFICTVDAQLPACCRGHRETLQGILEQLLSNAVKFTDQGRVSLSATRLDQQGERLQLALHVEDSGCGMPDEQRQRLFQPFTQGDDALDRRHGGLGMGLALAERMAAQLGLTLAVESSPGQGSRFSLAPWIEPCECLNEAGAALPQATLGAAVPTTAPDSGANATTEPADLDRLRQLLAQQDVTVNALVVRCRVDLARRLGSDFGRFSRAIDDFDYPLALKLLEEVA